MQSTQNQGEKFFNRNDLDSKFDIFDLFLGDFPKVNSSNGKRLCCQWTQTELTFPPKLPEDVEAIIAQFCTFREDQSVQPKAPFIQPSVTNSQVKQTCQKEFSQP